MTLNSLPDYVEHYCVTVAFIVFVVKETIDKIISIIRGRAEGMPTNRKKRKSKSRHITDPNGSYKSGSAPRTLIPIATRIRSAPNGGGRK